MVQKPVESITQVNGRPVNLLQNVTMGTIGSMDIIEKMERM